MSKTFFSIGAAFLIAASGASAQQAGDILFINGGAEDIELLSGSVRTTLFDFDESNTVIQSMSFGPQGPGGDLFVTEGPRGGLTPASVLQLSNPFGAQSLSTLSSGGPLRSLVDIDWDAGRNQFVTTVNPSAPNDLPENEGLASVGLDGTANLFFSQAPLDAPRPAYIAATEVIVDSITGDYLSVADNGGAGVDPGVNTPEASTLWRIDESGNQTLVVDFTDALVGIGSSAPDPTLARVRGLTQLADGDLVITDLDDDGAGNTTGGIYRVDLDTNGDFVGISIIAEGLAAPAEIEYDPFTDSLVFWERDFVDSQSGEEVGALSRINLDGSGYEVLTTDVIAREILIVPTPGSAAVLAIAGLAATRRRR